MNEPVAVSRTRAVGRSAAQRVAPPVGVAVVGCGYWGPKVTRSLSAISDFELRAICDQDRGRLEEVHRRFPGTRAVTDFSAIMEDEEIAAVAICTPIHTHHELAAQALRAGKHVLVEKPLTDSVETAQELVTLADERGLTLMVDHVFIYNGAVRMMKEIIERGEMGRILYFDSVRVNLGLFQSDSNVVWDLAPHDISIMDYVLERRAKWVSAVGSAHFGKLEDVAYITLMFEDSLLAHFHVNWLAPVKLRSTFIGGSNRMMVYDDLAPSEKILVYDKGVDVHRDLSGRQAALIDYRQGDMYAPYVDKTEPLIRMCREFFRAITTGTPAMTDGRAGLRVVEVLEAAQRSLDQNGARIPL